MTTDTTTEPAAHGPIYIYEQVEAGKIPDAALARFLRENRYVAARRLADGRIGAVARTIFNHRLMYGDGQLVDQAFCYATEAQAVLALASYDPPWRGPMDPPFGWHKEATGKRRVRPGGDPAREYLDGDIDPQYGQGRLP